jgi:hypothetical protein
MMLAVDTRTGTRTCRCKAGYQLVTSAWLGVAKCVAQSRIAILNSKVSLSLASTVTFADFGIEETAGSSMAVTFSSGVKCLSDLGTMLGTHSLAFVVS